MWRTMLMAVELAVLLFVAPPDLSAQPIPSPWLNDFAIQPIANRPPLEVRDTDGMRDAFEISAAGYQLLGELRKPHCLRDAASGEVWLELSVQDTSGTIYSVRHAAASSRINLYRRGPYYCEVHWLDLSLADEAGNIAPLKGDLALLLLPAADSRIGDLACHKRFRSVVRAHRGTHAPRFGRRSHQGQDIAAFFVFDLWSYRTVGGGSVGNTLRSRTAAIRSCSRLLYGRL